MIKEFNIGSNSQEKQFLIVMSTWPQEEKEICKILELVSEELFLASNPTRVKR